MNKKVDQYRRDSHRSGTATLRWLRRRAPPCAGKTQHRAFRGVRCPEGAFNIEASMHLQPTPASSSRTRAGSEGKLGSKVEGQLDPIRRIEHHNQSALRAGVVDVRRRPQAGSARSARADSSMRSDRRLLAGRAGRPSLVPVGSPINSVKRLQRVNPRSP
jgi:hypothetical protein